MRELIQAALRRTPSAPEAGDVRLAELQSAVEALTAVLERLSVSPRTFAPPAAGAEPAAGHKPAEPQLARELQRLLQEIEAEP